MRSSFNKEFLIGISAEERKNIMSESNTTVTPKVRKKHTAKMSGVMRFHPDDVQLVLNAVSLHQKQNLTAMSRKELAQRFFGTDENSNEVRYFEACHVVGSENYKSVFGRYGGIVDTRLPLTENTEIEVDEEVAIRVEGLIAKKLHRMNDKKKKVPGAAVDLSCPAMLAVLQDQDEFADLTLDELKSIILLSQENEGSRPSFEIKRGKGIVFYQRSTDEAVAAE